MRTNLSTTLASLNTASGRAWHVPEPSNGDLATQICVNRGIAADGLAQLLDMKLASHLPDPSILTDMDAAAEALAHAIVKGEAITVYGDYDVDGATSTAIMRKFLAMAGHANFSSLIPDREFGYGFSEDAAQEVLASPPAVLVLLDCGTHNHATISLAASRSVKVVVVDHHQPGATLPDAHALVNPHRGDERETAWPLRTLCTAGLAFMLAVAVNRRLRELGFWNGRAEPRLAELLDLVALGTVCDVMPLTGLNRAFVALGIQRLRAQTNRGLTALCRVASVKEGASVTSLGFALGPRINAGGRIGKARLGSDLLSSEDEHECAEIAMALDGLNKDRQAIEQAVREKAEALVNPADPIIVVAGEGWNEGVIGIVAGRLKETWRRPTIVVAIGSDGSAKGSGRSIAGVNLGEAMMAAREAGLLTAGGGHAMACGLSTKADQIEALREFLVTRFGDAATTARSRESSRADAVLWTNDATLGAIEEIERLGPFGQAWSRPRFVMGPCTAEGVREASGTHLFFSMRDGNGQIKAKAWRAKDTAVGAVVLSGRPFYAMVTLETDTWNGRTSVSATIEDVAHAD